MPELFVIYLKKLYRKMNTSNGILMLSLLLLIFFFSLTEFRKTKIPGSVPQGENPSEKTSSTSLDTYIPKDHVLIPIEIENAAAVEALMGSFSLADLYKTYDTRPDSGKLIASGVKLVRAPLDPREFAVLVHKSRAKWLMQIGTRYRVLIQNYKSTDNREVAPVFYDLPLENNAMIEPKIAVKITKPTLIKTQNQFKTKIEYQN